MTMKWCPACKRNVNTEPGYSLGILIVLLILFIIPGIIYWAVKRGRRCPICHTPDGMLTAPNLDDMKPGSAYPGGR